MEHTKRVRIYEPRGAVVEELKGPSLSFCHTANEISIGQICCRSWVVHETNPTSNSTLRGPRKTLRSPAQGALHNLRVFLNRLQETLAEDIGGPVEHRMTENFLEDLSEEH